MITIYQYFRLGRSFSIFFGDCYSTLLMWTMIYTWSKHYAYRKVFPYVCIYIYVHIHLKTYISFRFLPISKGLTYSIGYALVRLICPSLVLLISVEVFHAMPAMPTFFYIHDVFTKQTQGYHDGWRYPRIITRVPSGNISRGTPWYLVM